MSLIRNLQKKPEPARRGIAFAFAAALTVVIVAVWAVTLDPLFQGAENESAQAQKEETLATPLELFAEDIRGLFRKTQSQFRSAFPVQ